MLEVNLQEKVNAEYFSKGSYFGIFQSVLKL